MTYSGWDGDVDESLTNMPKKESLPLCKCWVVELLKCYFLEAKAVINYDICKWQLQMNTFIGTDKYSTKTAIFFRCWHGVQLLRLNTDPLTVNCFGIVRPFAE